MLCKHPEHVYIYSVLILFFPTVQNCRPTFTLEVKGYKNLSILKELAVNIRVRYNVHGPFYLYLIAELFLNL